MNIHHQDIKPRFEVERLEGKRTETRHSRDNDKGVNVSEEVEVDAGFMVYFPNGNSIRVADEEELRRLGFDQGAEFIDMNSGEPLQMQTSLRKPRRNASTASKEANT